MRVETVAWENSDMGEWTLTLDGQRFCLGEHGAARELWELLDGTIGAHYREGAAVRAEMLASDPGGGYSPDDPKSPEYADRMRETADMARKAAKEAS